MPRLRDDRIKDPKLFAARFTERKLELNVSDDLLSRALAVSFGAIDNWCRGSRLPTTRVLNRLAIILRVNADWLCGADVSPKEGYANGKRT